jgi:hypothetical protein
MYVFMYAYAHAHMRTHTYPNRRPEAILGSFHQASLRQKPLPAGFAIQCSVQRLPERLEARNLAMSREVRGGSVT